jgi:hypothetical protein
MRNEEFRQLIENVRQRNREYRAARAAANRAHLTRALTHGGDLNDGVEPTESAQGLHAPHDHYEWTWVVARGPGLPCEEFHKTAMGGEFLPYADPEKKQRRRSNTTRVSDVPAHLAVQIARELCEEITVYSGQVWDGEDGETCHLYVDSRCKDIVEMIKGFVEAPRLARQAAREAREAAERAASADVPEGRHVVTGTILRLRSEDNPFAYNQSVTKVLVQDETGFKVWGTLPSALWDAETGEHITFTASLTPSNDDVKFGFFKRPTKASTVTEDAA